MRMWAAASRCRERYAAEMSCRLLKSRRRSLPLAEASRFIGIKRSNPHGVAEHIGEERDY
jgi:hypothetical protein